VNSTKKIERGHNLDESAACVGAGAGRGRARGVSAVSLSAPRRTAAAAIMETSMCMTCENCLPLFLFLFSALTFFILSFCLFFLLSLYIFSFAISVAFNAVSPSFLNYLFPFLFLKSLHLFILSLCSFNAIYQSFSFSLSVSF
jgi:hypothetical protein